MRKLKSNSFWIWLALAIGVVALALALQNTQSLNQMREESASVAPAQVATMEQFTKDVTERLEMAAEAMDKSFDQEEVERRIIELRTDFKLRYFNLEGDLSLAWQELDNDLEEVEVGARQSGSDAIEDLQQLLESWQKRL
jgi:hypothetical protein